MSSAAIQDQQLDEQALHEQETPLAADDFRALEERVLRTVELFRAERERRASAEQHAAELTHQVEEHRSQIGRLEEELGSLQKERDNVRQRVERLLRQLDEVTG